ncbi:MAG: hypothetical protein AMJ94_13065 [Deltaproteobacteria bacterium SM23_61]|nr:MAG: hypothetical protein AMJ94_13065 [Deltaproteobacteria bacterium SM23_61]
MKNELLENNSLKAFGELACSLEVLYRINPLHNTRFDQHKKEGKGAAHNLGGMGGRCTFNILERR